MGASLYHSQVILHATLPKYMILESLFTIKNEHDII